MVTPAQQNEIFKDLGLVFERLWTFHQAMRVGRPIEDAEGDLSQLASALTLSAHAKLPGNFPPPFSGASAAS
jgi:hypothetical protein